MEKAEEHCEIALRQAHELAVVISQPETRRRYARVLIDRDGQGDREKARQLVTEAIATYCQIGMPKRIWRWRRSCWDRRGCGRLALSAA